MTFYARWVDVATFLLSCFPVDTAFLVLLTFLVLLLFFKLLLFFVD